MDTPEPGAPALPPPPVPPTHTGAVVALVCGILAWVALPLVCALVAVVAGHMARGDMKRAPGRWQGDTLAVVGLVLGWVQLASIVLAALVVGVLFLLGGAAIVAGLLAA